MNTFVNLIDGRITTTTYRPSVCAVTTLEDLITHALAGTDDYLTASYSPGELCDHPQAVKFINQYGDPYGVSREGTELTYWFEGEEFIVFPDNTVAYQEE